MLQRMVGDAGSGAPLCYQLEARCSATSPAMAGDQGKSMGVEFCSEGGRLWPCVVEILFLEAFLCGEVDEGIMP
jgi:hypothetical protein